MRSQGSSPMLRSVHRQTAGCFRPANALQHLAPPGSESGRTRFLCQQDFSRTHTRIPQGSRESHPKRGGNNTGCHWEKTGKKMSTPRGEGPAALYPPPSHTHFLIGGCFHPHEMRWINHCAQNSRLLDWLGVGEGWGKQTACQNEMNVVNLVKHPKIPLIGECTRR